MLTLEQRRPPGLVPGEIANYVVSPSNEIGLRLIMCSAAVWSEFARRKAHQTKAGREIATWIS
jgi:hypothetical protein